MRDITKVIEEMKNFIQKGSLYNYRLDEILETHKLVVSHFEHYGWGQLEEFVISPLKDELVNGSDEIWKYKIISLYSLKSIDKIHNEIKGGKSCKN